jgi:DNA-binding NarL/FixJ family response regulator
VRVVIAEDLFLLRDGLTRMLQAHGLQITSAVDNGADLLAAVANDQPDVAIVDVRLPPTFTDEGIRAALAARREMPSLPVLVSTSSSYTPASCWPAAPEGSATCSRTGCSTAPSSSTPSAGSRPAAP